MSTLPITTEEIIEDASENDIQVVFKRINIHNIEDLKMILNHLVKEDKVCNVGDCWLIGTRIIVEFHK